MDNREKHIINQQSLSIVDTIITHKEIKYIDLFCGLGAFHYYIDKKVRRLNVNEGLKMFGFDEIYKWNTIVKNE